MPHAMLVGRIFGTVLAVALSLAVSVPARADVIIGGVTVIDGDVPFISDNARPSPWPIPPSAGPAASPSSTSKFRGGRLA